MKSLKSALLCGFLVWVIPFAVAILIFPLRANERPLFESIMPVIVSVSAVFFSILYFKKVKTNHLREGLILGGLWITINIAIDLLMFMEGPMKMSIIEYVKDIAVTYLIIPATTIGFGYLIKKNTEFVAKEKNLPPDQAI